VADSDKHASLLQGVIINAVKFMFALKVIFENFLCFFERVAGGEIISLSSSSLTRKQNKLNRPSLLIFTG
jgi:hypothetical protein